MKSYILIKGDRQTVYSIKASGIDKLVNSLGITNMPAGFDVSYDLLFGSSSCARPNARPAIIMVTDGYTSSEFVDFLEPSLRKIVNSRAVRQGKLIFNVVFLLFNNIN